jgi:hypothetical protein
MFNIFRHQGDTNQNCNRIPSPTSQNGYHQGNKQVLARMQDKKEALHTVGANVN